jgi:transcriptional regulator with XRE-family HTH domain
MPAQLFHSNIKVLRLRRKLTQKSFSEKIGVELKRYAKWEEGRSQPDIDNIEAIATVHMISVDQLLHFDFKEFLTEFEPIEKKTERKKPRKRGYRDLNIRLVGLNGHNKRSYFLANPDDR